MGLSLLSRWSALPSITTHAGPSCSAPYATWQPWLPTFEMTYHQSPLQPAATPISSRWSGYCTSTLQTAQCITSLFLIPSAYRAPASQYFLARVLSRSPSWVLLDSPTRYVDRTRLRKTHVRFTAHCHPKLFLMNDPRLESNALRSSQARQGWR